MDSMRMHAQWLWILIFFGWAQPGFAIPSPADTLTHIQSRIYDPFRQIPSLAIDFEVILHSPGQRETPPLLSGKFSFAEKNLEVEAELGQSLLAQWKIQTHRKLPKETVRELSQNLMTALRFVRPFHFLSEHNRLATYLQPNANTLKIIYPTGCATSVSFNGDGVVKQIETEDSTGKLTQRMKVKNTFKTGKEDAPTRLEIETFPTEPSGQESRSTVEMTWQMMPLSGKSSYLPSMLRYRGEGREPSFEIRMTRYHF